MSKTPAQGASRGFLEHSLEGILSALSGALQAEEFAAAPGWLQKLEPRVKVAGCGALILAACLIHHLAALFLVLLTSVALAALSRIPLRYLALREWLPVLLFSAAIVAPVPFLTPGPTWFRLGQIVVSRPGAESALMLILRTETTATLALLLVATTRWNALLRGARRLGLPALAVLLMGLTLRYCFVLLNSASEMLQARRARLVGGLDMPQSRHLVTASAGVLLDKSLLMSSEVHAAMVARGFRGEMPALEPERLTRRDLFALAALLLVAIALTWWGLH